MKDDRKKKAQLIGELAELRRRVSELETTVAGRSDLRNPLLEKVQPSFSQLTSLDAN